MACCADVLEHCHGVLVRHADGSVTCEDGPACPGDEPIHDWVLGCAEHGCPCAEGEDGAPMAAAA